MPVIYQKYNRRHFLQVMAGATGAVATMGLFPSFMSDKKTPLRLVLLSDTHISEDKANQYRGYFPYRNLQKTVARISETDFPFAVVTGDLARSSGKPGDYKNLKGLIEPLAGKMPVAMTLGNHDSRDHFLDVFNTSYGERQHVKGKYVLLVEHPLIRLILLDSLIYTNLTPPLGLLGKAQREWLSSYLAGNTDKPVILLFHHTPGDGDSDLEDTDRLFHLIRPHRQVKALIFGHSHVYGYAMREDIHLINLPATGYNFHDQDPLGWVETVLTPEKGIFTLHTVAGRWDVDGSRKELHWRE